MIAQRLNYFAFIVGKKLGGHDANILEIGIWIYWILDIGMLIGGYNLSGILMHEPFSYLMALNKILLIYKN